jgi:hypothetical protein
MPLQKHFLIIPSPKKTTIGRDTINRKGANQRQKGNGFGGKAGTKVKKKEVRHQCGVKSPEGGADSKPQRRRGLKTTLLPWLHACVQSLFSSEGLEQPAVAEGAASSVRAVVFFRASTAEVSFV